MQKFLTEDFLLESETAKRLYHEYAKDMPIFDYHCHLTAEEIAKDRNFSSITEMWLGEDHYKWRVLRSNGVAESYITGQKSEKEKFLKWAETIPHLLGNPLYHWTHLELQRCFAIDVPLSPSTAEQIWEQCNEQLQKGQLSTRAVIDKFNVKVLCTTDDPTDTLYYHEQLKADPSFDVKVLPTFRPDKALDIGSAHFTDWLGKLEKSVGQAITTYHDFLNALKQRVDFFDQVGCRLSDHGLDSSFYEEVSEQTCVSIFNKRIENQALTEQEIVQFRTAILLFLGKLYAEKGWAMQFHIGGLRHVNEYMVEQVGINSGFDSINDFRYANDLAKLMSKLELDNKLPKTILYNLNPNDNYMLATMAGNFQKDFPGKIQFGTAWWFNDHREGIESQIQTLANVGVLSTFVGMLTDSRSILSYTRHEYFRRILCNILGRWIENGEYPAELKWVGQIVENIAYHNIKKYLDLDLDEK
ncbi:glucuronate isomerase [Amphibacillus sp. Q70]|uniref:glucuronate isomerase n=1 Tax=Amphibacillus sp. Q70 TaxID=3453416 RepID=UPI003F83DA14